MKMLIRTLIATVLLSTTLTASIYAKENPLKGFNNVQIFKTYLDAVTAGNPTFNQHLFSSDFEYINVGLSITKYTKKQYCEFLAKNKGLVFNCSTSQEILRSDENICIAKIKVNFETFTRIDYVTLERSQNSWKVNKVVTTYP